MTACKVGYDEGTTIFRRLKSIVLWIQRCSRSLRDNHYIVNRWYAPCNLFDNYLICILLIFQKYNMFSSEKIILCVLLMVLSTEKLMAIYTGKLNIVHIIRHTNNRFRTIIIFGGFSYYLRGFLPWNDLSQKNVI